MNTPCLRCTVDQSCCRNLNGLTLNEEEHQRLFSAHSSDFRSAKNGKLYKLYSDGGESCPHWDGQCQVYESRPMDCDLYPYTIANIFEGKDSVYATFHSRTECPLTDELIQPREQASETIYGFLSKTYGPDVNVTVRYDEGAARAYHLMKRATSKLKHSLINRL
jgi:Fe-S-cluster containining protein